METESVTTEQQEWVVGAFLKSLVDGLLDSCAYGAVTIIGIRLRLGAALS